MNVLYNGVLFNISWLIIVTGESLAIGLATIAVHLALHFRLMGRGMAELKLIAAITAIGLLLDQALFFFGVFLVNGAPATAPLWLSCLWPVFATTLCHAFSAFSTRLLFAAALGAVSGAGSYIVGTRLTAVDFASVLYGPMTLAVLWAILFPAYLVLAARMVPAAANNPQAEAGHA